MRKHSKKSQEQFNRKVHEYVGTVSADGHTIETEYGTLLVTVHPAEASRVFSIFGCFDDPSRARQGTDCNPYSGKWNVHCFDAREALRTFQGRINAILA